MHILRTLLRQAALSSMDITLLSQPQKWKQHATKNLLFCVPVWLSVFCSFNQMNQNWV